MLLEPKSESEGVFDVSLDSKRKSLD